MGGAEHGPGRGGAARESAQVYGEEKVPARVGGSPGAASLRLRPAPPLALGRKRGSGSPNWLQLLAGAAEGPGRAVELPGRPGGGLQLRHLVEVRPSDSGLSRGGAPGSPRKGEERERGRGVGTVSPNSGTPRTSGERRDAAAGGFFSLSGWGCSWNGARGTLLGVLGGRTGPAAGVGWGGAGGNRGVRASWAAPAPVVWQIPERETERESLPPGCNLCSLN